MVIVTFHYVFPCLFSGVNLRAIFLRCVKVTQTVSSVWFANLAAFFCILSRRLSDLLCMDSCTQPHVHESDALVRCRLNFSYCYSSFWEYALWNEVPSRLFVQRNLLDQLSLNHCFWLSLNICNYSFPEFFGPPERILHPSSVEAYCLHIKGKGTP
jgi:hypothetical protein